MPDHENIEALVLYDLSGKALISMKEFRGKGIDISSLEPGYYLAKIQASHQIFRSVLIKL